MTAEELQDWPEGKLEELLRDSILAEMEPGTTVICDECDERCEIEPQRRTDPRTGRLIGVYVCMREDGGGRIEIALDRLRRWKINGRKLAAMGYRRTKGNSSVRQSRPTKRATEKMQLVGALLAHHGFSDDMQSEELNMSPATQTSLGKSLQWGQEKVSRVLKRAFPEGFWTQYRLACKSDVLRGFLKRLEDDTAIVESTCYHPYHPTQREEQASDHFG